VKKPDSNLDFKKKPETNSSKTLEEDGSKREMFARELHHEELKSKSQLLITKPGALTFAVSQTKKEGI